ncbi:MAG: hypothetical protein ACRD3K_12505, partial [Edaphobacter sp.]
PCREQSRRPGSPEKNSSQLYRTSPTQLENGGSVIEVEVDAPTRFCHCSQPNPPPVLPLKHSPR